MDREWIRDAMMNRDERRDLRVRRRRLRMRLRFGAMSPSHRMEVEAELQEVLMRLARQRRAAREYAERSRAEVVTPWA